MFGSVRRKEDARLIRGQGRFVDDMDLPGMLHGAVLRSPYAHAEVLSIEPGVATSPRSARSAWRVRNSACTVRDSRR